MAEMCRAAAVSTRVYNTPHLNPPFASSGALFGRRSARLQQGCWKSVALVTAADDASVVQTNWSLVEAVNQDFAKGCVLVLDFCWEEREIQFWAVGARVSHLADVTEVGSV